MIYIYIIDIKYIYILYLIYVYKRYIIYKIICQLTGIYVFGILKQRQMDTK